MSEWSQFASTATGAQRALAIHERGEDCHFPNRRFVALGREAAAGPQSRGRAATGLYRSRGREANEPACRLVFRWCRQSAKLPMWLRGEPRQVWRREWQFRHNGAEDWHGPARPRYDSQPHFGGDSPESGTPHRQPPRCGRPIATPVAWTEITTGPWGVGVRRETAVRPSGYCWTLLRSGASVRPAADQA